MRYTGRYSGDSKVRLWPASDEVGIDIAWDEYSARARKLRFPHPPRPLGEGRVGVKKHGLGTREV